jgi:hypothetical protein
MLECEWLICAPGGAGAAFQNAVQSVVLDYNNVYRTLLCLHRRRFPFSNGVTVPARTLVSMPSSATHRDEGIYPNPDAFDRLRFGKLREGEVNETINKYQTRRYCSRSTNISSIGNNLDTCIARVLYPDIPLW